MARREGSGCATIGFIIIALIVWGISGIKSCVRENNLEEQELIEYNLIINKKSDSLYIAFLNKYPDGKYFEKIDNILWEQTLLSSNYDHYLYLVPKNIKNEHHMTIAKDSFMKLDNKRWSTDKSAWNRTQEINTPMSYKRYIREYPKGKKINQAKKLAIDTEVDFIFKGNYGKLPEMERVEAGKGKTTNISVYNNTGYKLKLLYSGIESESLEILPGSSSKISLINGNYRIAASVDANVKSFAGTETLAGGQYSVKYYITTK